MTDKSAGKSASVQFIEIDDDQAGQRVDNFLIARLKGVPKSKVYRIVRKGEVRVNKKRVKPEYKLCAGDLLRVPPVVVSPKPSQAKPSDSLQSVLEAAVLYEDDGLLIINKPSGLAVHGGSGVSLGLIEAIRQMRPQARFLELVHRLDRDTSGCVMIAKKRSMLRYLHQLLRSDGVDKRYLALVDGRWPARRRVVSAPLAKNQLRSGERMVKVAEDGKKSITEFAVVECFPGATLVEAKPITGRTHQIRVHAQYAGHSLLGDEKYTLPDVNKAFRSKGLKRLFLHACSLSFITAEGKRIAVQAPLADELLAVLNELRDLSEGGQ